MYDPNPARFTSTDPIGFEAGDPNLYRYVANNPTNATDPSGMDKLTIRGDTVYWEVDKGLWNPNLLWQVGKKVGDHIEIEWGDFRVKVSEKDLAQFIRDHTVGEGDDQTRIGYLFWLYRDTIFVKPPPARPAPPKPPLPAALPQNPPRPPQDDLLPPIGQPLTSGSGRGSAGTRTRTMRWPRVPGRPRPGRTSCWACTPSARAGRGWRTWRSPSARRTSRTSRQRNSSS